MKNFLRTCTIALALVLPAFSVGASGGKGQQPHARAFEVPGHDPIGKPGDGSSIDRTIELSIRETESGYMLFEPDALHIESGSVVRFLISNLGGLDHESFSAPLTRSQNTSSGCANTPTCNMITPTRFRSQVDKMPSWSGSSPI